MQEDLHRQPANPVQPAAAFYAIFAAGLALLGLLIAAALLLPAPWSWAIGFAYIAYDTWLLAHHLGASRVALAGEATATGAAGLPTATVLIAARNEGATLAASVAALGDDPAVTVVVVDDGSDDGSATALAERHGLAWSDAGIAGAPGSRLLVLRQARGGKANALNRALRHASGTVVVTVDADTVLAPGALTAMRRAFADDPRLVAACGVLRPTCAGGWLAPAFRAFQAREYERAFFWRLGWAAAGSLVLVSGAFAAYRRDRLMDAGGFDERSLVEDYELMYRLHARQPGLRARVVAAARATTDAPGSPGRFLRQRARWFAGFLATLWRYRALVGDRRLGHLGTSHLRLKTLDMLLPLWGLAAWVVLAALWWRHGRPDPLVLWAIAGKAAIDAALHAATAAGYRRWLGRPGGATRIAGDLLVSLAEQVCFQPLRQLGAGLGWLLLARRIPGWAPQRNAVVALLLLAAGAGAAELADGLRLKAEGRLPEAEAAFRAAGPEAVAQLATVVGWQGRYAEAEALWQAAIARRPDDPDLRVGLARVRYWRGELDAAAAELDAALALRPADGEARQLAGAVALARRERTALGPRVDLGAGAERYSAVHGDAHLLSLGAALTRPGLGTISGGGERRWIDGGRETTWHLGLGGAPLPGLEAEAATGWTEDRILAPERTLSVDLAWWALPTLAPVAGWRRSWWPGDRTDLYRPGLRAHPCVDLPAWRASTVEARALIARSPPSGVHSGGSLRAMAEHRSGLGAGIGWALAEEAEPPRAPTRVQTWSLTLAWTGAAGGLRLDLEREDRRDDWVRDGVSLGGFVRW